MRKKRKNYNKRFDLDKILYEDRKLFLMNTVNYESSVELIKYLHALDKDNHKLITIYINTNGGHVESGFAIMDAMQEVKSRVKTIITGAAYSMGSLISIIGDEREMTELSAWMAHPVTEFIYDYSAFIKDRVKSLNMIDELITELYDTYTFLSHDEIEKAKRGELWLSPKECLEKGIIDNIISRYEKDS